MERKVTVALIQMRAARDLAENLERAVHRIRVAARRGARIICLQELFSSPYFCSEYREENFSLAEPVPGPTTRALGRLARSLKIVLIAPVFERRAAGIYHNTALVIDADGSVCGHYRKMHLPDDPHFYEKYYFTPGDLGFRAVQTRYAKIGVLICWDQWFPEAARLCAVQGAQILFYPTAIGSQEGEGREAMRAQRTAWEIVQRGHAVANEIFVAACNRVGREGPITFWGRSFVSDPFGSLIAQARGDREEILLAACDLDSIEKIRQAWPFLRDRRIDAYQGLTERFLEDRMVPSAKRSPGKMTKSVKAGIS